MGGYAIQLQKDLDTCDGYNSSDFQENGTVITDTPHNYQLNRMSFINRWLKSGEMVWFGGMPIENVSRIKQLISGQTRTKGEQD